MWPFAKTSKRTVEYIGPDHDRCAIVARVQSVTTSRTSNGAQTAVRLKIGRGLVDVCVDEQFVKDFPAGEDVRLVVHPR